MWEAKVSRFTSVASSSNNIFMTRTLASEFFAFETHGALEIALTGYGSVVVFRRQREYRFLTES